MLLIPVIGPWLGLPVLYLGASLLAISLVPGFTSLAPIATDSYHFRTFVMRGSTRIMRLTTDEKGR